MNFPFGNAMQFMNQFNQFRSQYGKDANPNQIIQDMMNQGRISQQQYDYASRMANQIRKSFK